MPDYSKGKIYRIVCNTTGKVYIGSTSQDYLSQRLRKHVEEYKKNKEGIRKSGITSIQVLENQNYEIILVELYPCKSKDELHSRERYHIENNECVNKVIPKRTHKEYYYDNHESILEKKKDYKLKNREKVLEKKKEYYYNNKDKINEYYENNKEVIAEKSKIYREINKEKIKETQKLYQANNREKINEMMRNYHNKKKKENKVEEVNEVVDELMEMQSCNSFYINPSLLIYEWIYNVDLQFKNSIFIFCLENTWIIKILFKKYKLLTSYNKKYQNHNKKQTIHAVYSSK